MCKSGGRAFVMTNNSDSDDASGSLTEDLYKQSSNRPVKEIILRELKCLELRRTISTLLS